MHVITNDKLDTDLRPVLLRLEPFVAFNGKLTGCPVRSTEHWPVSGGMFDGGLLGKLDSNWRAELLGDHPVFVVWSYGTPIAWLPEHGNERAPSDWVVPLFTLSATTGRHQGMVRNALDLPTAPEARKRAAKAGA